MPLYGFPSFTTTTPTPSSTGGAFTTASSSLDAMVMNKAVLLVGTITITTVGGSASGTMTVALPVTPAKSGMIAGVNINNGRGLSCYYNSGSATLNIVYSSDGASAIAANNYQFAGIIEST